MRGEITKDNAMNPLTIPFRRRWLRLLLALGYAATAAWLIYNLPPARTLEVIFMLLLFAALLVHACTLCYRYAAFILRREFVRLDGRGITIRHNALPKGRELHLPWERVLDAWTDEVQRRTRRDRLLIAWKTADAAVAAHVALELKYASGSDSQGRRLRGAALGAYLVKHISAPSARAVTRREKRQRSRRVQGNLVFPRAGSRVQLRFWLHLWPARAGVRHPLSRRPLQRQLAAAALYWHL